MKGTEMIYLYIVAGLTISGLVVMIAVLWPRKARYIRPTNWPWKEG